MVTIKDLFKIVKGKKTEESPQSTELRYIQIEDLRNDANIKYAKPDPKNILCSEKDILIAWDGANAGTIGYGIEGAIGSTIAKLTAKNNNLSSDYVGRYLQSKFKYLRDNCTGATIPHISRTTLENLCIPLPPLETQKKIAEILDAADTLRQKTKTLIEKYDQLTQSLFLDMFGDPVINENEWKKERFENLVDPNCPLTYGIVQPGEEKVDGILCVRPIDLISQYITVENIKKIDHSISKRFKRTILKGGEILLSVRGSIGAISFAGDSLIGANVTRGIVPIWFDKEVSNKLFFYHLYKTRRIQQQIKDLSKGATLIQINLKDLRELELINPPLPLQTQFAKRVQAIEEQKAKAQASLEKSEELFQSLLQKAFRGEIN